MSKKIITQTISVTPGSQFLGTEFSPVVGRTGTYLLLQEVDLAMGVESKTWQIRKDTSEGESFVVAQSLVAGVPAATTDDTVMLFGDAAHVILRTGDSIQIVTSGAGSAMSAKVYYEELD